MTDSRVCFMAQIETARTHLSYFINFFASSIFSVSVDSCSVSPRSSPLALALSNTESCDEDDGEVR